MPRPRLVLLHYSAPPVVGGVEAVLAIQARLFAAAGYPTSVLAGRTGEHGPDKLGSSIRIQIIPEMDSRPGPDYAPPAAEFDALRETLERRLGAALHPHDIVIAHNLLTTHYNLPLTAALFNLAEQHRLGRLIAWCHDLSRYVNPASGAEQRPGQPWDLLRRYRPEVTYVAVSRQRQMALAKILNCAPEVIQVIPNGVDPQGLLGLSEAGAELAARFGLLAADLIILMPVRITRVKNIEFAMRVTAALQAAGQRVRLVVTGPPDPHAAGAEDYFGSLQALRHSLALDESVVFLCESVARLPSERVAELYRLCDLVLMPSLREGFGMPVLEAGLVGKPVFATVFPIVSELEPDLVQRIAPEETPAAVAERIAAGAAHDPVARLRRLTRQQYAWSAIFERSLEPLVAAAAKAAGAEAAGAEADDRGARIKDLRV